MSNIQQRDYYKIFAGTNQTDGYDKIHLGYEALTTEITLKKDDTTFFHIPFFTQVQNLTDSTLVADGATPGPIPALADRISKKLGGYGNSTPWGNPSERQDGTWFCSWLYAVSSENPQWLDRYYNPGRLAYKEALEGTANFTDYVSASPIYYDVPSSLTLEPGVLYRYHHNGEEAALSAIQTFAGKNNDRLRLSIENWTTTTVDSSIYNNTIVIDNFKPEWIVNTYNPGYQDRSSFSFDNNDFINCRVIYDDKYNLTEEFTLSFWTYNKSWSTANSTQLIGNLKKGGYGVFYNNLNYNPYFVVPENTYGHLFYFNQEGNCYTDKNVETKLAVPTSPVIVNINSNSQIITLQKGITVQDQYIIKYNHIGDILAFTKLSDHGITEDVKSMIIDKDDNTLAVTISGTYTFNNILSSTGVDTTNKYAYKQQLAYDLNGTLHRELSCIDVKFDANNNKWVIKEDNNLYCNNVIYSAISDDVTNIAIDPENNLWVLAGINTVYKINTITKVIIDTYEVGTLSTSISDKNISFLSSYDRTTNTTTWYALLYYNNEKTLYQVTLDGLIYKSTFLVPKLNILEPATALQNKYLLSYTGNGDFTGYEWRRIFSKVLYNNNPQVQFKLAAKEQDPTLPNTIYTVSVPVNYFVDNVWHLITVTYKNNVLKVYVDNYLRDSLTLTKNINFNFDYKNDLYIGCPTGKTSNLNTEIGSTSVIWNGYIDSIKIYDYAIIDSFIPFFVREKNNAVDINWNIPTAALQYVEVIERFFKHRLPGSKSVYFNIKLSGVGIVDAGTRLRIENDIRTAITAIKPAYTELLKVEWLD